MKLGVAIGRNAPESFHVCVDNIAGHLESQGVEITRTLSVEELRTSDVIWDPCCGGGRPPRRELLAVNLPLVVTLHGLAPLELGWSYARGLRSKLRVLRSNRLKRKRWSSIHQHCFRVVTVSDYSRRSILALLGLPDGKVVTIPNAVNAAAFEPGPGSDAGNEPFFLHVSNDEPRKNVDRIIEAHSRLDASKRWPLVLKLSGNRHETRDDVTVVSERLSEAQLASLYHGAGCFVFPSLYEGFGLPILEAMAARCPVITSNGTACKEVAGDAALLVPPRDVNALRDAMDSIMRNSETAATLVAKGSERLYDFSWNKSAQQYLELFRQSCRA